MANDFLDKTRDWYGVGPEPTGVQQVAQRAQGAGETPNFLDRSREWYTGANTAGTSNGYNTDFFQRFMDQQNKAAEAGTLGTFFDAKDATGVVTYDHNTGRGNYKFGDVYDNGEYKGNLYDSYEQGAADLMMSDLMLDAGQKSRAFTQGEAAVSKAVQDKRSEIQESVKDYYSQAAFQKRVDATSDQWDDAGVATDISVFLAGAGGGTAVGAGIGSFFPGAGNIIGGAIGFVVGGVGALLNEDQILDVTAAAKVKTDIAGETFGQGSAAQWGAGLQGVGQVVGQVLSPTTNLMQGLYDANNGELGDGDSAWYAVDPITGERQRSNWWTAAQVGTMLIDFSGVGAAGAARALFQTSMWSSIAGQATTLATSGSLFDDSSGTYDNIFTEDGKFDLKGAAAGLLTVGIDVAQVGLSHGLGSKLVQGGRGLTLGQRTLAKIAPNSFTGRAATAGNRIETEGGFKYAVDAAGRAVDRKAAIGLLAPSEMIGALNASRYARTTLAARDALRQRGALTSDDYYRAAKNLAAGEKPLQTALVNGFGEGTEEVVQAFAQAAAMNSNAPGMQEIADAGVQGFAMGAGMTGGANVVAARTGLGPDSKLKGLADTARWMQNMPAYTDAEWKSLGAMEKRAAGFMSGPELAVGKAAAERVLKEFTANEMADKTMYAKAIKAQNTAIEIANGSLNARSDGSYRITGHSDALVPNHVADVSLRTVRDLLKYRVQVGLEEQLIALQSNPDAMAPLVAEIEEALRQSRQVTSYLDQAVDLAETLTDTAQLQQILQDVNVFLQDAWEMGGRYPDEETNGLLTEGQLMARSRAVTVPLARDPQQSEGSYQAFLPQANEQLTVAGADAGIMISLAVVQSFGGDFDGDTVRTQTQLLMDNASFGRWRSGANLITANNTVNILERSNEAFFVELLREGLSGRDGEVLQSEAESFRDGLREEIISRYEKVVPRKQLLAALDAFDLDLLAGTPNASAMLYNAMISNGLSEGLLTLGEQRWSNEPLWIDDRVHEMYQLYQSTYTFYAAQTPDGEQLVGLIDRAIAQPLKTTTTFYQRAALQSVTPGQTLDNAVLGDNMMRMIQKLKYAALNSNAAQGSLSDEVLQDPIFRELQLMYKAITQRTTKSDLEELGAKDEISAKTLSILTNAASSMEAESNDVVVLSVMQVPNYDSRGNWRGGDAGQRPTIDFLRWTLREVVEDYKAANANLMDIAPEIGARVMKIESFLRQGDKKHRDYFGDAFIEVFGAQEFEKILGPRGAVFGMGRTPEAWVSQYANLNPEERKKTKRALTKGSSSFFYNPPELEESEYVRGDPPYTTADIKAGKVTAYRVVADALMNAGNHLISMGDDGAPHGQRADTSDRMLKSVVEGLTDFRKAIDELSAANENIDISNIESLKAFLESRPEWSAKRLELLPDAIVNGAVALADRGAEGKTLVVAPWVYTMLQAPPEEGAMIYLAGLTLSRYNSLRGELTADGRDSALSYARLDDRLMQLMYRLDRDDNSVRFTQFIEMMMSAKSVKEFERQVNLHYRDDEVPYTGFLNDVSEFSPVKSSAGWKSASPGAELRRAAKAFQKSSAMLLRQVREENMVKTSDTVHAGRMMKGLAKLQANGVTSMSNVPASLLTDPDVVMYLQWNDRVEEARANPGAAGINVLRTVAEGSVGGINPNATDKGRAATHVALLGLYKMREGGGFDTPSGKLSQSMTAAPFSAFTADPSMLLRGGRTVDADGTYDEWAPFTSAELLALFHDNPAMRDTIKSLIAPAVYDETANGNLSRQYLTERSLESIIDKRLYTDAHGDSPQSKELYFTLFADAVNRTGDEPHAALQQVVETAIAHTSGLGHQTTEAERARLVRRTIHDLAVTMRMVGELRANGIDLSNLHTAIRTAIQDDRLAQLFGQAGEMKKIGDALLDAVASGREDAILKAADDIMNQALEEGRSQNFVAFEEKATAALDMVEAANRIHATIHRKFSTSDAVKRIVADFAIPENDAEGAMLAMQRIMAELRDPGGASLARSVSSAVPVVTKALSAKTKGNALPRLQKKEWETLSAAIIGGRITEHSGAISAGLDVHPYPAAKKSIDGQGFVRQDRDLWDPSYMYLLDRILSDDSAFGEVAAMLHKRAGIGVSRTTTKDLVKQLSRTVFNSKLLGPFTTQVPVAISNARSAMMSSPTESGIQAGGTLPQSMAPHAASTGLTWDKPDPALYSALQMTAADLSGSLDTTSITGSTVKIAGPTGIVDLPYDVPLITFEGRFVNGLVITYLDASGAPVTLDLWNEGEPIDATKPTGTKVPTTVGLRSRDARDFKGAPRMVTVQQLRDAVARVVPNGVKASEVAIDVQYLHPMSRPADPKQLNNGFFIGMASPTASSMAQGPIGQMYFEAGGISELSQNNAMSSGKKGADALPIGLMNAYEDTIKMEPGWETDFAGMLMRKAQDRATRNPGDDVKNSIWFNGFLREFMLQHLVVGLDSEGKPAVMDAESIIRWQAANPGAALPLENAQLRVLPLNTVYTLLGGEGEHGVRQEVLTDPKNAVSDVPAYRGFTTELIKAKLPNLLNIDRHSILDSLAGLHPAHPVHGMRATNVDAMAGLLDNSLQRRSSRMDEMRLDARSASDDFRKVRSEFITNASNYANLSLENLKTVFDLSHLGLGAVPAKSGIGEAVTQIKLTETLRALQLSRLSTAWVHEEFTDKTPRDGVLSGRYVDPTDKSYRQIDAAFGPAAGDIVVVNLDSFLGVTRTEAEARELASKRLAHYRSLGITVVLAGEVSPTNLHALANEMVEQGYISVGVTDYLFRHPSESDMPQVLRARASRAVETASFSAKNTTIGITSEQFMIDENTGYWFNPNDYNQTHSVLDLIPTEPLPGFAPPRGSDVTLVKELLSNMDDASIAALLTQWDFKADGKREHEVRTNGEQQQLFVQQFDEMVANWASAPEWNAVEPAVGQWLKQGTIIPLYSPEHNAVLLYRHGYDLDAEAVSKILDTRADTEQLSVLMYKPSIVNGATVHDGIVTQYSTRHGAGRMAHLDVPSAAYFAKLSEEGGAMKYVMAPKPDSVHLPDRSFLQSADIRWGGNPNNVASKHAGTRLVCNHGRALTLFGKDFAPELIKFFYGKDVETVSAVEAGVLRDNLNDLLGVINRQINLPDEALVQLQVLPTEFNTMVTDMMSDYTEVFPERAGQIAGWEKRLDTGSPEAEIARAALTYLMSAGARPEHILYSGGLGSQEAQTGDGLVIERPELFTTMLDRSRSPQLHEYLNAHYNRQINNDPNPDAPGYYLDKNFRLHVLHPKNPEYNIVGFLHYDPLFATNNSAEMDRQAADRAGDAQKFSQTTAAVADLALGAKTVLRKQLKDTKWFQSRANQAAPEDPTAVWRHLRGFPTEDASYRPWRLMTRAERDYVAAGRDILPGLQRKLDMQEWSTTDASQYVALREEVMRYAGLNKNPMISIFDGWVRAHTGQPADSVNPGRVSVGPAMEALREVYANLRAGRVPTHGAKVPHMNLNDLQALYLASSRSTGQFSLLRGEGVKATSWDDWVHVSLNDAYESTTILPEMMRIYFDAQRHTFIDGVKSLAGLPVSYNEDVMARLLDPKTDRLIYSIDPEFNATLSDPILLEQRTAVHDDLMNASYVNGRFIKKLNPQDAQAQRKRAQRSAAEKRGLRPVMEQSVGDLAERGREYVTKQSALNSVMHTLTNLRVGTTLMTPQLWTSAIGEVSTRSVRDAIVDTLTGESLGKVGAAQVRLGDTMDSWLPGIVNNTRTLEDLKSMESAARALGSAPEFTAMVYKQLQYVEAPNSGMGVIERTSARFARAAALMQDPGYRMRGDAMAKQYMRGLVSYIETMPAQSVISIRELVKQLKDNPEWAMNAMPEAHKMAMNRIANNRSLRATPMSIFLHGAINPLIESDRNVTSMLATIGLRWPMMFNSYMFNVGMTVTGMDAPMAVLASFLDGRKNWLGKWRSMASGTAYDPTKDDYIDMSAALEGLDISRAFIQSGVTHTALFLAASALGSAGLTGEDDEDRRRRRAAEAQGGAYVYDPRKLQNDFRNADALYFDNVPFLSTLFFNEDTGRSMAGMNWIVRQFVSPTMGIARFFETGDVNHITYGFMDAMGAFPIFNASGWEQAVQTATILQRSAEEAAADGTLQGAEEAHSMILQIVMTYEAMLFENSFVNTIYTGQDKYDRDPWVLPQTDVDGSQVYDKLRNPQKTSALQPFINDAGEPQFGYVSREAGGAQMRSLTENRLTLAVMMSLFHGFDDSYYRNNMAVKQRTVDKATVSTEDAKSLILSVWDPEGQSEVLTNEGGRAVLDGLRVGTVQLGDASLEGVYIPFEMRKAIQDEWMAEILQQGIDAGLTYSEAYTIMQDTMFGSESNPWATPVSEIIWSDQISYTQSQKYNQLNTTYTMGPDGRPWATGMTRTNLLGAFGLQPLQQFYAAGATNLAQDGRLNAVDEIGGINTGLRALERVDNSWDIPTAEEIGEAIQDSLDKLGEQGFTPKSYGGYGGGGGGGSTRLNPPQDNITPYGNDIPNINTNNPFIRRSSIRRERYSSDRGRLKSWQ